MAEYIPLMVLVVTVGGGTRALNAVQRPPLFGPPAPTVFRPPLLTRTGSTTFGRPAVTTPPGDPSLFAHVRTAHYTPAPAVLAPAVRLRNFDRSAFRAPIVPTFRPQTPTPDTGPIPKVA